MNASSDADRVLLYVPSLEEQPSLSFYLHTEAVYDFREERANLTRALRGRPLQHVAPIAWNKYLTDYYVVPTLYGHERRTLDPEQAAVHVVPVMPVVSHLMAAIARNASSRHEARMAAVAESLLREAYFRSTAMPFLFIGSFDLLEDGFTAQLLSVLSTRKAKNVIIALLDRSNRGLGANKVHPTLFKNAIAMPHVAGHENGQLARDCCAKPDSCRPVANRSGFVFMGDTSRFDGGARGAMRDIMRYLPVATTFNSSGWMRVDEATLLPTFDEHGMLEANPTYATRWVEAMKLSAESMSSGRLCWAPRGDVQTSRRMFDAIAAGCVAM
eukprot:5171825-Prymnesium_polylepis.1